MLRHGTRGSGAAAFREYGVRKAGHVQINDWARSHINKGNAAMWIAGPVPQNLQVRIVGGSAIRSQRTLLPVPAPGVLYGPPGSVAMSFVVRRSHAVRAAARVVERRVRRELCDTLAVSTYVDVTLSRVDREYVEVMLEADCIEGRDDEVARVLLMALDGLRAAPPSIDEINVYRNGAAAPYFAADQAIALAQSAASEHLAGASTQPWQELLADLEALSPDNVSTAFSGYQHSIVSILPRTSTIAGTRFEYVGDSSATAVPGARVRPVKLPEELTALDRELLFGPTGITLRDGDRVSAVRFDECALLLQGPNGYRELISDDGNCVVFIPGAWERGDTLVERIDSSVLPERRLILNEDEDRRRGHIGPERRRRPR
jgi:zinc protease